MSQPRVSVIVVSHGRPDLLCRAALSVFHQNHRPVELIIVADHVGLAAISILPFASRMSQNQLRQWMRAHVSYRSFAVIQHPLERAYDVFTRYILPKDRPHFATAPRVLSKT